MDLRSHIWAKLTSLLVGATLFGWYLLYITTDRATAKMLVFIPIFQYYEPTVLDYVVGIALATVGGMVTYLALTRLRAKLRPSTTI